MTQFDVPTTQGPARLDWTAAAVGLAPASLPFVMALTHGAGGATSAPDLRAARDAAVQLGGGVALITQPYRLRGARAPGSAERQDEAWIEIISWLLTTGPAVPPAPGNPRTPHEPLPPHQSLPPPHQPRPPHKHQQPHGPQKSQVPLIVGGRSNGARVACRTAVAVGARGVLALAFPLQPPARRSRGSGVVTVLPDRSPELRAAAAGGAHVLVLNGDRDSFGIPPGDASTQVVVLRGETHSLSKKPAAVAEAVAAWLTGGALLVP